MLNNGVDPKVIISETINIGLMILAGKSQYNISSQEMMKQITATIFIIDSFGCKITIRL